MPERPCKTLKGVKGFGEIGLNGACRKKILRTARKYVMISFPPVEWREAFTCGMHFLSRLLRIAVQNENKEKQSEKTAENRLQFECRYDIIPMLMMRLCRKR